VSNGGGNGGLAARLRASGKAGKRNDPLVGAIWVVLAMATFAGLGTFGKYAMQAGVDPLQVIFFRNFFCLILMTPLLYWRGPSLAYSEQFRLYGVRVGLSVISMMAWFSALSMIPLAELTAIGFLAPLFATVFAVFWLGEVVRARRWTALVVGFIGALIILRPGGLGFGWGQCVALFSAVTTGIIGPLLKQMTAQDDPDKIVFITNLWAAPASLIPALFVWEWPPLAVWPYLLGLGLCAVLGHVALLRGFASMDASMVFTFEFSRLPFAVLAGYFFLGETTDIWTWVGALIIFSSAAYITRREAQLARERGVRIRDVSDPLSLTPLRLKV
jgi:Permeases of the drug/metabolite transporter (DMT) superfamily